MWAAALRFGHEPENARDVRSAGGSDRSPNYDAIANPKLLIGEPDVSGWNPVYRLRERHIVRRLRDEIRQRVRVAAVVERHIRLEKCQGRSHLPELQVRPQQNLVLVLAAES